MSGSVALVGAGPGDPGLLTVKAARLIAEADTLVYDALVSAPIVALARADCEMIYVGKRARMHTMPQEQIQALLIEHAKSGKRVVRLKGGDPLVFGRGGEEAQELREAGVEYCIVPGISSALAAPAYAGIPVTHREFNTSFTVATGHEDPTKTASTVDWERLASGHGMSVFLMAMSNLQNVTAQLIAHGMDSATPVAVISDGTTPRQRTVVGTLASIVDVVAAAGVGAPAIVAVGQGVTLRDEIRWFDRHGIFGKRVLITRPVGHSDELVTALWEAGAEPVVFPTIAFGPAPDPQRLHHALVELRSGAFDWLVFTSRHAVGTMLELLAEAKLDPRALARVAIAAVGEKTAATLAEAGIRADLVSATATAQALASELRATLPEQTEARLLFWAALGASDTLPRELRAAGHVVDIVHAYRTEAADTTKLAEAASGCDVWTFASKSAVDAFCDAVPDVAVLRRDKTVACLGPVTAAALAEHGLAADAVAREASAGGLLEALKLLPIAA